MNKRQSTISSNERILSSPIREIYNEKKV